MAKRTKTAARAGKVKRPAEKPEWKALEPKEELEEDVNSDDGSFMDDDTEDFLPSGWTGNTKEKKEDKTGPSLKKKPEIKIPQSTQTKSSLEVTGVQSVVSSLEHITLRSTTIESETVTSDTPTAQLHNEANLIECTPATSPTTKVEKVIISRLEVPASLLHKPVSPVEEPQEQINSLKQQLKTTKYQATTTRTELEAKVKKQNEEIQKLQVELADKNGLRSEQYLNLKNKRKDSEAQRMKATDDYRKLMNVHATLKSAKDDLNKKWVSTKFNLAYTEKEVDKLRQEKQVQNSKILQLERQVKEGLAEKRRLDNVVAVAEHSRDTSRRAYNSIFSELQRVRSQLTNASHPQRSNHRSRSDYSQLRKEHDELRDDYDDAKQEIRDLKHDVKELKGDRRSLERKLDTAEDDLSEAQTRINRQVNVIKDLKLDVSALERDRDLKASILQIGVDVRLRNLEHAREILLDISRDEVDKSIIMNGNTAAHRANGAVDAAMFQAGLVSDEFMDEAKKVFKEMYLVEPSKYGCWPPKVLRLIDCRATIKTVKTFKGRNASADLRDEHIEIDNRLIDLHQSMDGREFEADNEVDELIEKLEALTTEIVEVDRSRGGRH